MIQLSEFDIENSYLILLINYLIIEINNPIVHYPIKT